MDNDRIVGVDGDVSGIVVEKDASEYPAALEASTNTVYCVPLARPVILADLAVLPRKNVPKLTPKLLVSW